MEIGSIMVATSTFLVVIIILFPDFPAICFKQLLSSSHNFFSLSQTSSSTYEKILFVLHFCLEPPKQGLLRFQATTSICHGLKDFFQNFHDIEGFRHTNSYHLVRMSFNVFMIEDHLGQSLFFQDHPFQQWISLTYDVHH